MALFLLVRTKLAWVSANKKRETSAARGAFL